MYMSETVVIRLNSPTANKAAWLVDLERRYTRAVQLGLDTAKSLKTSARTKIHHETYKTMRTSFELASEYARLAINDCVSLARSYYGLRKSKQQKRTSFPIVRKTQPIGLGTHAYKLVNNDGKHVLRVSTGKRGDYMWFPLCVPQKWHDKMQHVKGDAKLFKRGNYWFVMLPLRIPTVPTVCDGKTFIGIDLGIVRVATVSTPNGIRYYNGKAIRHRREHFKEIRKRYQRAGRRDRVKRAKGRERRWMTQLNHEISKEIVQLAASCESPVIVFENLTGIRERVRGSKRFNHMLSSWAFRQLIDFVAYKAERENIPVIGVDPRGTSRTCPKCGHSTRANRPTQSQFRCVNCHYRDNADGVASGNIAARGEHLHTHGQLDTARPFNKVSLEPLGSKSLR